MKLKLMTFILLSLTLLISCDDKVKEQAASSVKKPIIKREVNFLAFSRGLKLYQKNCASCHGKNAEGTPDWRKTESDGMFPPPPLNGTGHTWHHPTKVLVNLIKDGTAKIGGKMPAWKDKLSDQEINDILTWIKAQWPDEIYAAWYTNDQGSK
jgi:mono/diheme cytochrome c family protein